MGDDLRSADSVFDTQGVGMFSANEQRLSGFVNHRLVLLVAIVATMVSARECLAMQAAQQSGASIFPESTSMYLQVDSPDELIDKILEHPLREKIETIEQVQKALNSPQMKQGRIGLAYLETRIGEEWLPAVRKLTSGGLYVGADLAGQSVGVAFQASDEALLKKTAGEILGFVRQQGGEDAFKVRDYRDGKFAEFDNFIVARFGNWLIVSNQSGYARQMADNLLDGVVAGKSLANSLVDNDLFAQARRTMKGASDAWGYIDLDILRKAGTARDLFAGTTDEPGVELLFGGILEAFEDASYASASLSLDHQALGLTASLPFDVESARESREFFFGDQGTGRAPAPMDIPDLLGQAVTYRDLGHWWLSKEELFPENVIAGLAQADSQLSTFFGGADFGEDILGSVQPGLRLLVKEQEYHDGIDPEIRIPAFALVGRLHDEKKQRIFKRSFQSLVTFLNLDTSMDRPQFDVETTREDGYALTSARYYLEEDDDRGQLALNFSPALAFQGDYMILSSSTDLARELAQATKTLDAGKHSPSNTWLQVNAATIKKQLLANREALVAQSMVDGGKTREAATAEIDLALSLLDYARHAELDYRIEDRQMVMDLTLEFQTR